MRVNVGELLEISCWSPYYAASLYPGSGSSSDASAPSVPVGVDAGVSLALASLMPPTLPLLPPAAAAAAAAAAALMPYHPHVSVSQATSSGMSVSSHMAALSARTQPPPHAARHLHCGPAHSPPAARPRVARTSAFTVEELLKDRRSPSADVSARPHFPVIVSSLYGARAPPSPPSGDEQSPQRPPSATPARAAPPSLPPSPRAALATSTTPPSASPRRPDRPPASPGALRGLDGLLRRPAAHAPPRSPPLARLARTPLARPPRRPPPLPPFETTAVQVVFPPRGVVVAGRASLGFLAPSARAVGPRRIAPPSGLPHAPLVSPSPPFLPRGFGLESTSAHLSSPHAHGHAHSHTHAHTHRVFAASALRPHQQKLLDECFTNEIAVFREIKTQYHYGTGVLVTETFYEQLIQRHSRTNVRKYNYKQISQMDKKEIRNQIQF
ncbi:vegetative cell wall protein gp1-like [Penaeus chinensis]|uniref:vegetative cell wall protein gp1-like n=1 Tax=Penaeus chinensis TaxID=139456 RepID=UPI001FB726A1|nr:vegetative cell wall protein gp1-like [Penaeus chinensis]